VRFFHIRINNAHSVTAVAKHTFFDIFCYNATVFTSSCLWSHIKPLPIYWSTVVVNQYVCGTFCSSCYWFHYSWAQKHVCWMRCEKQFVSCKVSTRDFFVFVHTRDFWNLFRQNKTHLGSLRPAKLLCND